MVMSAAAAAMALAWIGVLAAGYGWKKAVRLGISTSAELGGEGFFRRFAAEPVVRIFEQRGIPQLLDEALVMLHAKAAPLKGEKWTARDTRLFAADAAGCGYWAAAAGLLIAGLSEEPGIAWAALVCGLLFPLGRFRELQQQALRRRQEMLLALPELIGKLTLLVGAGETVQKALMRCAGGGGGWARTDPLHAELTQALQAITNGQSFSAAMESFSRRCAVQEVSVFATVLLLNYRRGGDQLSLSLREISLPLWDKRRSTARARGEEASSKLVFPLTGIFFILMVLVGAPAMLMMNG